MHLTRFFDQTLLNATETYVLSELDASLKLLSSQYNALIDKFLSFDYSTHEQIQLEQ